MRYAGVDVQVAPTADRYIGTDGTATEPGLAAIPENDEIRERRMKTLNMTFFQVGYNENVDVLCFA
jgi:hypothetical protein